MSVILLLIAIILLCIALSIMIISHRAMRWQRDNPLREKYIAQITHLFADERPIHIKARSSRSRMALAEAIYVVMSHTYGSDNTHLRYVVEQTRLDIFLMRRLRFSHGTRKARILLLMSSLPPCHYSAEHFMRYTQCRDRDIRINALCLMLAMNPILAIRTIAALDYSLTSYDIARIVALLRRGILPIAYEPLLANENRNLRMLGFAIVRTFGIDIAEKRLHNIILSESDPTIVNEAIYTLASLSRPLHHARIRERVKCMDEHERKSLCRHLSAEGYSLSTVKTLFSESESRYAENIINSYKRALVRHTTTI